MSQVTEAMKANAEVYYGGEACREKFTLLLAEKGLPNGLIQLQEIDECGYVEDTGFVWLKLTNRECKKFMNIDICYEVEVTAHMEPNKITNITGIKAREFFVWVSLNEIYVKHSSSSSSITFKTPIGLSRSFQLSMFEVQTIMPEKEVKADAKDGKNMVKGKG